MREWPLVHPKDDGIRPAGKPNECFYCRRQIGQPHSRECVIVTKRVLMNIRSTDGAITGTWNLEAAHSASADLLEFMYNDGTWCTNNILAADYDVTWDQADACDRLKAMRGDGCLCEKLVFKFVRVIDDTPRRKLSGPYLYLA